MPTTRTRIAPSPTGNLHVGTARTALFNYLYAKHMEGQFILRVEDTDLDRSEKAYEQNIFDSLKALGLTWDEGPDVGGSYGPYRQSERLDMYREWAQKLIDKGLAYYCYLTEEELSEARQKATDTKQPFVYRQNLWNQEFLDKIKQDPNRKPSVRFRIPVEQGSITVPDIVHGDVTFDLNTIGDFVILKSNGTGSYNFACVVDDIDMAITHVIRGEDHLPNTPKQMLLYQALDAALPAFAHVGMILAPDRSKLSKRHGATAVSEYIQQGYLPEAFLNFLSLLGWSASDTEEIMDVDTIAKKFELDRIAHSGAVFDTEKLNWMNGMYIRAMALPELRERCKPFLTEFDLSAYTDEQLELLLSIVREPIVTLGQLPNDIRYFFGVDVQRDPQVVSEVLQTTDSQTVLQQFKDNCLPGLDFSSPESLGEGVKTFAKSLAPLKMKTIMWAIRAAVTGLTHGADLSTTLFLLGKDRILARVQSAMNVLVP